MGKWKLIYQVCLLSFYAASVFVLPAEGYISKRYTVEDIVDACTHILFGTVTEVNRKQLTAKLRVEENLKGRSEFNRIQIRLDVGQGRHPEKLMRLLKDRQPIIVFYIQQGDSIKSLAHVNGTWFQIMARDSPDKSKVWWGLTHIEIYLNGSKTSKRVSTPDFQRELRVLLGEKTFRLLFLMRNISESEHRIFSTLKRLGKHRISYQKTEVSKKVESVDADIFWIGYRAVSRDSDFFSSTQENVIKTFVKNGGVVIFSGQDFEGFGRTWGLPGSLDSVENSTRRAIKPGLDEVDILKRPNVICSNEVVIDDAWSGWTEKYRLLTIRNGGKGISVAMLKYGQGLYLITNLCNRSNPEVLANSPLLENLIHFACEFLLKD